MLSVAQAIADEKELKQKKILEEQQEKQRQKERREKERRDKRILVDIARLEKNAKKQAQKRKASEHEQVKKRKALQSLGLSGLINQTSNRSNRQRKLTDKLRDSVTNC